MYKSRHDNIYMSRRARDAAIILSSWQIYVTARQRRSHYRQPYKFQVCMTIYVTARQRRSHYRYSYYMPCNYKRNIKMYNRYRQMYKHVYIQIYIYICAKIHASIVLWLRAIISFRKLKIFEWGALVQKVYQIIVFWMGASFKKIQNFKPGGLMHTVFFFWI